MIYQIWTNFFLFFFAITVAPGISARDELNSYLIAGAIYIGLVLILPKIIEFFKINVNIASFVLVGGLMTLGYFYVMKNILIGFLDFEVSVATNGLFGLDFIGPEILNETSIIVYGTLLLTALISFNQWLMEK